MVVSPLRMLLIRLSALKRLLAALLIQLISWGSGLRKSVRLWRLSPVLLTRPIYWPLMQPLRPPEPVSMVVDLPL